MYLLEQKKLVQVIYILFLCAKGTKLKVIG